MNKEEKSCGIIIFCKDEFLVLQHGAGHWDFPKGHVEEGETEKQTAEREAFEETGLKVTFIDGFREETHYYPKPGVFKTVIWFLGYSLNKKVRLMEEEIRECKWLNYEDALKQLNFKNSKELLEKAYKFLQVR